MFQHNLPDHLEAELHTPCRDACACDRAKCRTLGVHVRVAELRVVQSVEGLPTELGIHPFRYAEVLEQARIPVVDARLLVCIPTGIADDANSISLCIPRE